MTQNQTGTRLDKRLSFRHLWVRGRTKRMLCLFLSCALLMQGLVSCAGGKFLGIGRGNKYVYKYSLTVPVKSPQMLFQNDSLKVQFNIDDSSVRFRLQNLTNATVRVQWNSVSIGVDNRFSWAKNLSAMYGGIESSGNSVPIPRGGYIEDFVIPADNIAAEGNKWVEKDLFPTTDGGQKSKADAIAKNIGKSIVLNLPLQFDRTVVNCRFEFTVVSVKHIPWSDVRAPKRILSQPPKGGNGRIEDQVTTAFVVVGLLGFVVFMVSLKKEPVVE